MILDNSKSNISWPLFKPYKNRQKDRGHTKGDFGKFIPDHHSMGFKLIKGEGFTTAVGGLLGQFIKPSAYVAQESRRKHSPDFVIFQ